MNFYKKLGEIRPNQLVTTYGPGSIMDAVNDSLTVLDIEYWTNDNIVYQGEEKISVAAIIVNGHATLSGKWIEGRDYITPALEPVIKYLNEELTREAMGR